MDGLKLYGNEKGLDSLVQTKLIFTGWVFVYELNGCGFESHCCHLKKCLKSKLNGENLVQGVNT